MTENATTPDQFDWKDLAVVFLGGALLAVFWRIPVYAPDEGLILTPAERILRGQIPYRDFFSEIAPGSFYIHAGLFRLLGHDLFIVRGTVFLLGVLLTWLVHRLSRRYLHGPATLFPPLVMCGVCYPYIYMVSHHWWGLLFYLLMLLCLTARHGLAIEAGSPASNIRLFVAGLLAAGAALCVQSVGVFALATVVLWLLFGGLLSCESGWKEALILGARRALWFFLGTGGVMGIAIYYFFSHGALRAWAYDNFVFLFTRYATYEISPGIYSWERLTRLFHWVVRDPSLNGILLFLAYYFFAVVAPVGGFSAAVWKIGHERRRGGNELKQLLLLILAGIGSFLAEVHNRDIIHLVRTAPIILILDVYAWQVFWGQPIKRNYLATLLSYILIAAVIFGAGLRILHYASWNSPVETRRGTIYLPHDSANDFKKQLEAIEKAVPSDGEAFFFPYNSNLYYLTATRNPTRYEDLLSGFHNRKQIDEAISTLRGRPQDSYIFSFFPLNMWTPRDHLPDDPPDSEEPDALEQCLRSGRINYENVENVEGMEVWVLKK